ncbi:MULTISPECIES: hypothetical protein [Paenibacillus]|uniref:hypothetical protein n=1 Tax=Paenibacillus TaxID=44249 RepID=UPI0018D2EC44|nr:MULTISPECIES: hypothetical protein [Paenibacillus]
MSQSEYNLALMTPSDLFTRQPTPQLVHTNCTSVWTPEHSGHISTVEAGVAAEPTVSG